MSPLGINSLVPATVETAGAKTPDAAKAKDPAKIRDAAQQFEALLLGQILRSVREADGGWLGSGSGASSDSLTEFAEQHLASMLAQHGGLGLAGLISQGLERGR
jgi:flagellar protein FlgJ